MDVSNDATLRSNSVKGDVERAATDSLCRREQKTIAIDGDDSWKV